MGKLRAWFVRINGVSRTLFDTGRRALQLAVKRVDA
jgi:hypothetical protein